MSERPLLIFPTPQSADRTKLKNLFGRTFKPDLVRQGQRLLPMFNQLQTAFETRSVEIQQYATGSDPEQVLVIETIGNVNDFANAVKHIKGLEWMGELDVDEIQLDPVFYDENNPEDKLSGRLYLVMTNQRALNEMLSLWRRYQANPNMQFERGLTKFRDIFQHLNCIRRWDVQERLHETGVIKIWQEDLKHDSSQVIPFEVELWFRRDDEVRATSASQVSNLIRQAGGRILSQSIIEDIAYHGLLAELPAHAIKDIVESQITELVKCDNIMFFRPIGQMAVGDHLPEGDIEFSTIDKMPQPTGEPIIALLDGLPLANHHLLANYLVIEDPDGWDNDYSAAERIHGSAMASLIIHGDLNQPLHTLSRKIYVRPIMKPLNWPNMPRPEEIPDNCLVVDLIHRAVKRLFEGEQGGEPVAPQIRIINLSIGDKTRQFTRLMSPLARLIDWLSVKYNVLFIVSAGNHTTPIPLNIPKNEFDLSQTDKVEVATIKALYKQAHNRRLLSPSETINGISVGAVHFDEASFQHVGSSRFDPFKHPLPSPISAFGSGYRRAIKPDMIFYGGRQLYRLPLYTTNSVAIEPAIFRSPPGNKVASPGPQGGELNATSYCCGTSNATALLSHAAGICYDSLQQIFAEQPTEVDARAFEAPLLKAMLVHGCSWGDIGLQLSETLRTPENGYQLKGMITRWIGYGKPNIDFVLGCTEQRATVLGFGQLSDGDAHVFNFPLPPSLASCSEKRRLTVTLAWLSPIAPSTQKYRVANLWFEIKNNDLTPTRKDADRQAVRRGTVQHEIFEGQSAVPFIDGEVLEIKVNCRRDAGIIYNPIAYGLVVSLEVAEGINIAVYDEIRNRINPAIQIQQTINHSD